MIPIMTKRGRILKGFWIAVMFSMTISPIISQTSSDIIRYSFQTVQGTARAMGVGNAMGGLGGDFTSLSINPAGIGGYWKSELVVSPVVIGNNTRSSLAGGPESQTLARKFALSNLGLVFTTPNDRGNWRSVSLGFGINKLGSFNQEFFYNGATDGSITDRFAGLAHGLAPDELDPFEARLAHRTEAIFDLEGDDIYETDFDNHSQAFGKNQTVTNQGYNNEMVVAFGGNLNDKLLLGLSLGIPFVSYESAKSYVEFDEDDVIPVFNRLQFDENLTTQGGGINIKLGAIAKLKNNLRIGAAFHSPTYLSLTDRFTTDLSYEFDQGSGNESYSDGSPDGEFEYALITPWKAVANAAWIIGKKGFVSTDLEYVDYSSAKYDFTTNSESNEDRIYQDEVNAEIKSIYRGALNLRLGGELALQGFRFRAGTQFFSSPFVGDSSLDSIFSLGAGVRGNKAFLDLAFSHSTGKDTYLPYSVNGAPNQVVTNHRGTNQIVLTVGFKI